MASYGFEVTVLEKNKELGGRARRLCEEGFTFDMGPTWYWMPDVFEKFFADFGRKPSDYYSLERLDPSYRIYYGENDFMDVPVGMDAQCALFENLEPGSSKQLKKFLMQAQENYRIAVQDMVYKPGNSVTELISRDTISNLHLFTQSIRHQVRKKFRHPHLVRLLEFPVLFLGAKPGNIPAFYNFMNYADLGLGTWYPKSGMFSVVEAMVRLARELGVKFLTGMNVESIVVEKEQVSGIRANGEFYSCDLLISGADYHHTETLLDEKYRVYSDSYWSKKTFAPSALLFFLGINKKLSGIRHHTLFFDEEFDKHAESIYDDPRWPDKPLFYASFPSVTDENAAPRGCENVTLLIPLAPGIEDTEEIRESYYNKIMNRLERLTRQELREAAVYKRSYCINDFVSDYNSYKGNAYGLANTLMQTACLRPSIKSKKINNLFFTGQLTVPGPGVPPAIISGKIVAGEVCKKIPVYDYAN